MGYWNLIVGKLFNDYKWSSKSHLLLGLQIQNTFLRLIYVKLYHEDLFEKILIELNGGNTKYN